MIVGNDISKYQLNIDWDTYKNNSNFVIIKASEGVGYTDPNFKKNQEGARRVGLPVGYYHFARPDIGNTPENEAMSFLNSVGLLQEGEVLCLDYEPKSDPNDPVDWCWRFLLEVKARTGVSPFIYLNKSQVKKFKWETVANTGFPLWLADYQAVAQEVAPWLGPWTDVYLVQWTSSQTVPGIPTAVDGDWFYGTLDHFKYLGYHKPVEPSSSESPSMSPSPSVSESPSMSPSPSEPPAPINYEQLVNDMIQIIFYRVWSWNPFSPNCWTKRFAELKAIIYAYHL